MAQREDLIQELKQLSQEDMSKFTPEELTNIENILAAPPAEPLLGATSRPSLAAEALQGALPIGISPSEVLPIGAEVTDIGTPFEEELGFDGFGQAAGGVAGGLVGATRGQRLTSALPGPLRAIGPIVGGALGSFTGGAVGDLSESGVEGALNLEGAPEGFMDAVRQAASAGGEEALFDVVAQSVFRGTGAAFRALRPKATEMANSIRHVLEKGGTNASIGQLTDNVLYTGMEKMTRGALFGGTGFAKLDLVQDKALVKYTDEYIQKFTDVATSELDDVFAGKLILDTIEGGRRAHGAAATPLYAKVDELAQGVNLDLSGVIKVADTRLKQLKRTGEVGRTPEGGPLLDRVAALNERMTFSDAQVLRSDLLEQGRLLSDSKKDLAVARNINDMVKALDSSFDDVAVLGNPEAVQALRAANKFWRFGKNNFNNKLIKEMVRRPDLISKIAPSVFRSGNREQVVALRRAVKAASLVDDSIVFKDVWGNLQGSYLKSLAPQGIEDIATSQIRRLHKDTKLLKTMSAGFTSKQQKSIVNLSRTIDEVLSRRGASTGLLSLRQIGAAAQIGAAGFAAGTGEGISLGEGAAILTIPVLFSVIARSPKFTKSWIRWAKAKPGSATKLTALTKLAQELGVRKEALDPEGTTQAPEPRQRIR